MNEDPISSASAAAQRYASQTVEQVRATTDALAAQAQNCASQFRSQAEQAAGQVREGAQRAFQETDHYVRENPWTTLLGAAGIGLVIGFALAHRREPSFRERYLDEPSDHARELLRTLVGRLNKDCSHARSSIDDVTDDSARHAGKLIRKLRFW